MDCYGQGYCMSDKTCQCLSGFSGKDCNKGLEKDTDPFVTEYEQGSEEKPEEPKEEEEKPEDEEDEELEEEEEEEEEEAELFTY
jgi:ribosomal protein L12E/L44/L45/RPP1/RPP2